MLLSELLLQISFTHMETERYVGETTNVTSQSRSNYVEPGMTLHAGFYITSKISRNSLLVEEVVERC